MKDTPRKHNTSCVKDGKGSTGETFWHSFHYIDVFRPCVTVLESVPNLAQEIALRSGTLLSDLSRIAHSFEEVEMTCLSTIMDRRW